MKRLWLAASLMAASEGHRAAQYRLGRMFDQGKGLPQRPKIATKPYIAAAEQGYNPAIHRLWVLAEEGDARARRWARAAEK